MTKKRPAFKRDAFSQVLDEAAQDLAGGMKFFLLGAGEGEADDFLDPTAPDDRGHPAEDAVFPILPLEQGGDGDDAVFVVQDALDDARGGGGDAVVGRTLALEDFPARLDGVVDEPVEVDPLEAVGIVPQDLGKGLARPR